LEGRWKELEEDSRLDDYTELSYWPRWQIIQVFALGVARIRLIIPLSIEACKNPTIIRCCPFPPDSSQFYREYIITHSIQEKKI
jgi:hypothetical protein